MIPKYLPQDNEARLNGGIVRYDGVPYYLQLLPGDNNARLSTLGSNQKSIDIQLNDPKLDVSSPPLGYLNYDGQAFYLVRRPLRNYKQSLHYNQLSCYKSPGSVPTDTYFLNRVLYSKAAEEMFLGNYPSLSTAINRLSNHSIESIALSRNVALVYETNTTAIVCYKADEVGKLNFATNVVSIPKADLAWIASKYLEGFDWKVD